MKIKFKLKYEPAKLGLVKMLFFQHILVSTIFLHRLKLAFIVVDC